MSLECFFYPPSSHEIEIIEAHIANANNLSFLDSVLNPPAIFWYMIHYLKNIENDLT